MLCSFVSFPQVSLCIYQSGLIKYSSPLTYQCRGTLLELKFSLVRNMLPCKDKVERCRQPRKLTNIIECLHHCTSHIPDRNNAFAILFPQLRHQFLITLGCKYPDCIPEAFGVTTSEMKNYIHLIVTRPLWIQNCTNLRQSTQCLHQMAEEIPSLKLMQRGKRISRSCELTCAGLHNTDTRGAVRCTPGRRRTSS